MTDQPPEPPPGSDAPLESAPTPDADGSDFRSGFVTLVGRPNVGKSTLLNQILGEKVSIVSDKPQTTRHQIRGVLNAPGSQIVFVDTPGIHKPRTLMGERLNDTASDALAGVDIVCLLIDATQKVGPGDRYIAERVPTNAVLVLNKVDRATPEKVAPATDRRVGVRTRVVLPDLGPDRGGCRRVARAPAVTVAARSALVPRRRGHRPGRGVPGRRIGPGAAPGRHPRGTAALHRHPGHRVGMASDQGRDPGRARVAEGHRHRQGRCRCSRRSGPGSVSSSPTAPSWSSSSRSTRTGSPAKAPWNDWATEAIG